VPVSLVGLVVRQGWAALVGRDAPVSVPLLPWQAA